MNDLEGCGELIIYTSIMALCFNELDNSMIHLVVHVWINSHGGKGGPRAFPKMEGLSSTTSHLGNLF
jgi:hypothetical protein